MRFEGREFFNSKINNSKLTDYNIGNYENDSLEYRKQNIEKILNQTTDEHGRNFFEAYEDDFFKVNLNCGDSLSGNINVHQKLEIFADYLLNSKEIREERKSEKTQYYFYMNKEEFKLRTNKEILIESMKPDYNSNIDNVIHFLLEKPKNTKIKKDQFITAKDLKEDSYCGEVLRQYKQILDRIDYLLKNPQDTFFKRYKITSLKKSITDDMISVKRDLKGIFGDKPRNLLKDSTCPSWDEFDFKNKEHVKRLIYIQKEFIPDDDVSILLFDLDMTIEKLYKMRSLTKHQYEIIKMIRQGYKNIEICNIKQIAKPRMTAIVNTVVHKINKYYIDLEEV